MAQITKTEKNPLRKDRDERKEVVKNNKKKSGEIFGRDEKKRRRKTPGRKRKQPR